MEEEGKRIKREKRLSEYRIGMLEKLRVKAEENLGAIEQALNAEEENLERLKAKVEDKLWAQVVEAGKRGLAEETG